MNTYEKNIISIIPEDVPGDIIEIGVYRGRNSKIFTKWLTEHSTKVPKDIYMGFDTFKGYMDNDLTEDVSYRNKQNLQRMNDAGRWKYSSKQVVQSLKNDGLDQFVIIEGDCKETLPDVLQCGIRLLYIDCNAYVPAMFSMMACLPFLEKGAVVAIDEHTVGGETKALKDFADKVGLEIIYTGWEYPNGPPMYVKEGRYL